MSAKMAVSIALAGSRPLLRRPHQGLGIRPRRAAAQFAALVSTAVLAPGSGAAVVDSACMAMISAKTAPRPKPNTFATALSDTDGLFPSAPTTRGGKRRFLKMR